MSIQPGAYRQLFLRALTALEPFATEEDKEAIEYYRKLLNDPSYKFGQYTPGGRGDSANYACGELFFRS